MKPALLCLLALIAFALGMAADAKAQAPAELEGILQWDIHSAHRDSSGAGSVTFVRPVGARTDTLHVLYGTQGQDGAWKAYLEGQRYVFAPAYGFHAVTDADAAFLDQYQAAMIRAGDDDANGVPDVIDALRLFALLSREMAPGDNTSPR